jgi:hypothetical protein
LLPRQERDTAGGKREFRKWGFLHNPRKGAFQG